MLEVKQEEEEGREGREEGEEEEDDMEMTSEEGKKMQNTSLRSQKLFTVLSPGCGLLQALDLRFQK